MNLQIQGTSRSFIVVVPNGYNQDQAYPLVFGMHGLQGSGQIIRSYASIESQTAGQAIHFYPSAIGGQWNLSASSEDFEFFDAMIEYARTNLCIDNERIFSYGHSYGGFFSNALACNRSDVLRAIGPTSGGGPNGSCGSPVAAILLHGTDDGTVNISSGRGSRDYWLSKNGCGSTTTPITPSPCVEYQGCDADSPVVWCEHNGINHSFPSSVTGGSITYGPAAIWSFFQRF